MITLIGGEKGGTGKSTLATNIAAFLAGRGFSLLLVDCDKQGTAQAWAATRRGDVSLSVIQTLPLREGHGTANLAQSLLSYAGQVDHVVVDCGGQDSRELRAAMAVADVLVTPFRPSQADLWTLQGLASLVHVAQGLNPRLTAKVVINQASSNWRVNKADAATELIESFENLTLAGIIRMREAFDDAMTEGRGILEWTNRKAQQELTTILEDIYGDQETEVRSNAA